MMSDPAAPGPAYTPDRQLGQQVVDDLPVHIGQPEIAAGVAVGQLLVIDAQDVQQRGVQVVDGDAVFDGAEAEFVGCAVGRCRL